MKKLLYIIFLVCICLGGCTPNKGKEMVYNSQSYGGEKIEGGMSDTYLRNNKLYAGVESISLGEERYRICIYDLETKENTTVVLKGIEELYFEKWNLTNDGEYVVYFENNSNENELNVSVLATFDMNGNLISKVDITDNIKECCPNGIGLIQKEIDRDGNLWFYDSPVGETTVYCINREGETRKVYNDKNSVKGFVLLQDKIYVIETGEEHNVSNIRDLENGKLLTMNIKTQESIMWVMEHGEDALLISDFKFIYKYNLKNKKIDKIFSYEDMNIRAGFNYSGKILYKGDGTFYVLEQIRENDDGRAVNDWYVIREEEKQEDKEIITIAASQSDYALSEMVRDFNNSNQGLEIKIKYYELDENGISNQLLTEIAAGNAPDVFATNVMDLNVLIEKGLACSLNEYLQNDKEISIEDFVGDSLNIYSKDGNIYALPREFCIMCLVGKKNNMENYNAKELRQEDIGYYSRGDELELVRDYVPKYYDEETKETKLNVGELDELLQFLELYPLDGKSMDEDDGEEYVRKLQEDSIKLEDATLYGFRSVGYYKAEFEAEIEFVPYPLGTGVYMLESDWGWGYVINPNSTHKEEVWEFLKDVFTFDYESYINGFPVYRPIYEKEKKASMEKKFMEQNGEEIPVIEYEYPWGSLQVFALRNEDANQVEQLIINAKCREYVSPYISNILIEEIQDYFYNNKTKEQMINIIESRINIYMTE